MTSSAFLCWHGFAARLWHVGSSDVGTLMPSSFHGAKRATSRAAALSAAVNAKPNTESFILRLRRKNDGETVRSGKVGEVAVKTDILFVELGQLSELFGELLVQIKPSHHVHHSCSEALVPS